MGVLDPWWNEADRAELDALTWELSDSFQTHREHCQVCIDGYPPCVRLGKAIQVVIDFREGREKILMASWMRKQRLMLEHDLFKLRLFEIAW